MNQLLLLASLIFLTACDRFGGGPKTPFDGAKAYEYVQAQVAFGPRVPGTPGHARAGEWIVEQMRSRADTVIEQRWTHVTRDGKQLPMRNVLARFNPGASRRVLYLAHWDTRPVADSDPNFGNKRLPIPGANDGASGVALLVALADQLKAEAPTVGVDLLFVDGEDYGSFDDRELADVLIGARYFSRNLPSADYRPLFGVVWDMIGDANLHIYQEGHSMSAAPEVVARVWDTAAQLGYGTHFIRQTIEPITDDHVPLIQAGLRVIDVIDINYASPDGINYHHTMHDTIDKVSRESLQVVGDVALTVIRQL